MNFEDNNDLSFKQRAVQIAVKQMEMDGEKKAFVVENSVRKIGYAGRVWLIEVKGKDLNVKKTNWTEVYTNEEKYKKEILAIINDMALKIGYKIDSINQVKYRK